jgi:glycosyltransferase A (GT-A) superfamily protein (DUF2064 family)
VVYGPATDGGFWLVGCSGRRAVPPLFDGVRWSSPQTLQDCTQRLNTLGNWSLAQAACLADVDGPAPNEA